MDKENIIRKIKEYVPLIYDVVMTEDMGYEFSAISADGIVYPNIGMLLSTKTKGQMPDWWGSNEHIENEYKKKTEEFLGGLDIIPYKDLSTENLMNILDEIESLGFEGEQD